MKRNSHHMSFSGSNKAHTAAAEECPIQWTKSRQCCSYRHDPAPASKHLIPVEKRHELQLTLQRSTATVQNVRWGFGTLFTLHCSKGSVLPPGYCYCVGAHELSRCHYCQIAHIHQQIQARHQGNGYQNCPRKIDLRKKRNFMFWLGFLISEVWIAVFTTEH